MPVRRGRHGAERNAFGLDRTGAPRALCLPRSTGDQPTASPPQSPEWVALAAPAVVFWAGALLVWASAGWSRLSEVTFWLNGQTTILHLAAGLAALTVPWWRSRLWGPVGPPPVLQLLEGYWPLAGSHSVCASS